MPKKRPEGSQNFPKSSPGSLQTQCLHDLRGKFHFQSPRTDFLSVFCHLRGICVMSKPSKNLVNIMVFCTYAVLVKRKRLQARMHEKTWKNRASGLLKPSPETSGTFPGLRNLARSGLGQPKIDREQYKIAQEAPKTCPRAKNAKNGAPRPSASADSAGYATPALGSFWSVT